MKRRSSPPCSPRRPCFAYAVGSPANGTFTVLPQAIAIQ